MNVPYVSQTNPTSCGAASLSMILKSFNTTISEGEIWQNCAKQINKINKQPEITNEIMANYANHLGFPVLIGQIDINNIVQVENFFNKMLTEEIPIIALSRWTGDNRIGHYLVVYEYSNNRIYFHNPENNLHSQKESIHTFIRKWKIKNTKLSGVFVAILPKTRKFSIENIQLLNYVEFGVPNIDIEVASRKVGKYSDIGWIRAI